MLDPKTARMVRGYIRYETIGARCGLLAFAAIFGTLLVATLMLYGMGWLGRIL